jgi:hypothetical protein
MDWQQERRAFWERICVAHVASYALADQPVAMADRLVRAWEERFPKPTVKEITERTAERLDVRFGEIKIPQPFKLSADNIRRPICPDCGGYLVGGGCTCSPELRRQRWEYGRAAYLSGLANSHKPTNKLRAYLKIGMYQSVVPCPVPPDPSCDLHFAGRSLKFSFLDSGAVEDDGIPIWIAESVDVK